MPENIYHLKIFAWIEKEIVDWIISSAPIKSFDKWDLIIKEWDLSNWEWYIIKNWEVEVSIKWSTIANLWTWDIVWEMALLSEEERSATVKAQTNTDLIVLSLNDLIEMINNDENNINKEIVRRIEENLENE